MSDLDVVIENMPVKELHSVLKYSYFKGKDRLTLGITIKKFKIEITNLRSDTIQKDLKMRDITVNSIAFKVENGKIIDKPLDPTGGINDIHYRILRTYDKKNLRDDPLRILRILRFNSVLGYQIESSTLNFMSKYANLLKEVPEERIQREISSIILGKNSANALRTMYISGILKMIIPELEICGTFLHKDKYHFGESIFEHSLRVIENCETDLDMKLSALLHDIAKPLVYGKKRPGSYIGHDIEGTEISEKILSRLKFPKNTVKNVGNIIRNHMIFYESEKVIRKLAFKYDNILFDKIIKFIKADKMATNIKWLETEAYDIYEQNSRLGEKSTILFERIRNEINGKKIMECGLNKGPWMKQIIDYLHNYILEKPSRMDDFNVKIKLERELLFNDEYSKFRYGKIKTNRIKEYFLDNKVFGLLENEKVLNIKTGIFEFNYLKKKDYELCLKENSGYHILFQQ